MTLVEKIKWLEGKRGQDRLTDAGAAMYLELLIVWNSRGRKDPFTYTDAAVMEALGWSRAKVQRTKRELIAKGYVTTEPRKVKKPTQYHI